MQASIYTIFFATNLNPLLPWPQPRCFPIVDHCGVIHEVDYPAANSFGFIPYILSIDIGGLAANILVKKYIRFLRNASGEYDYVKSTTRKD